MSFFKIFRIVSIICAFVFFSCKPTIKAQQKKGKTVKEMVKTKPKFSEKDLYSDDHKNTIKLIGEFVSIENNVMLCKKKYEVVISFKVEKILNSGSAVINQFNKGQTFKAVFSTNFFLKNNKSPDLLFKKGDLFEIALLEQLCSDVNKTNYRLISFIKM